VRYQHGDSDSQFIVAYYIAHAFTIRFKPGFGPFYTVLYSLLALFFPYFGLILAARSMEEFAIFEDNPLDTALKAGGLCTVAGTTKWRPKMDGDEILYCEFVFLFSEVSKLIADKDCFVLQRQGSGQRWFV
jgi:hypothetical protein